MLALAAVTRKTVSLATALTGNTFTTRSGVLTRPTRSAVLILPAGVAAGHARTRHRDLARRLARQLGVVRVPIKRKGVPLQLHLCGVLLLRVEQHVCDRLLL